MTTTPPPPLVQPGPPPAIVVCGVSGSGKSTLGTALAQWLAVPFVEGDALHPAANVAKMAAGIPLDDDDRAPWLDLIAARIAAELAAGRGVVVACSALKRAYRDRLRAAGEVSFVHLALDRRTAAERVSDRPGHFMPAALVDSQFASLEPLGDDERGVTLDSTLGLDAALAALRPRLPTRT